MVATDDVKWVVDPQVKHPMNGERSPALPPRTKGRPRAFDRDQALNQALDVFWRRGYELASVADLCTVMGINPPSLYSAFGNKAKLFLEAVDFYEARYWDATWQRLETCQDIHRGVAEFFDEAAHILLSPQAPCGCLVALAATNVSEESVEVRSAIDALRLEGKLAFAARLERAVKEGQLPLGADCTALAGGLNTMLEGMSIQARDGLSVAQMRAIGALAARLLPERTESGGVA